MPHCLGHSTMLGIVGLASTEVGPWHTLERQLAKAGLGTCASQGLQSRAAYTTVLPLLVMLHWPALHKLVLGDGPGKGIAVPEKLRSAQLSASTCCCCLEPLLPCAPIGMADQGWLG